MVHNPVLVKEVLEYLDPGQNENFVDGTVGQAGHTLFILEKNKPDGRVLGIDLDARQIENSAIKTKEFFKERVVLVHDSYAHIKDIIERNDFKPVNGIVLDLGYSSWQLEESTKGFSFQKDELLDMRYDLSRSQSDRGSATESGQNTTTAEKIVNEYSELGLEKILEEFGEEKYAKKIARKIIEERKIKKIESTFQLRDIIQKAVPQRFYSHIHFATRTFQALRIAVNDELGNLTAFLPDALDCLSFGGRLVVISFHSLEDRIVKNFFKEKEKSGLVKILTPKPVIATDQEIAINPRSRSAKLRAIIKN